MKRALALVLGTLLLASPPPAGADFSGLRVNGPPGAWRATNSFFVEWDDFPGYAVGYRFLTPWAQGNLGWNPPTTKLAIEIPTPPGAAAPTAGEYELQVWLWKDGISSPPSPSPSLPLRYDPSVPGPPALGAPWGWLGSRDQVAVSIDPPAVPPSGIGGYALSVSAAPGEAPCAASSRCTDAELDQLGGPVRRQSTVGPLPEGVSYVNVVAVSGAGVASAPASVPIKVDASPPAIRFAGVPTGWANHPVAVAAIAEDRLSGTAPAGPGGPLTALAVDGGVPSVALGGAAATTVSGDGTHLLSAWARDGVGNATAPGADADAAAAIRIDERPPRVAFAAAQRPGDPELIEVVVDDQLSGPSSSRGSVEVRAAGSSRRFEELPTRATARGLEARWSSDDFPPGPYEFRAIGFDAAGNATRSDRRADGSTMVLSNPVKLPTAVASGFGGSKLVWQHCHRADGRRRCHRETVTEFESRPALRTVPYGRSLRFGGVLHSTGGEPLGGLPVEVVETFAPGADLAQRRTTATSRPDGRFDTRLAPGPSRRVEAFFAGTRTLTRSGGRAVTMAVRAGVRFRTSTTTARIGGEPVIFSGRLLAGEATIPRTGRPIQLEFRVPGGTWNEFRTVQTDRFGRFRYPYAFTDDDSRGIRFQFRAVSPEQSDFPYRPAASAPVNVIGY